MAWSTRQGGGKPTSIPKFDIDSMLNQPRPLPTSRGIPRRSPGQPNHGAPAPYMRVGTVSTRVPLPKHRIVHFEHTRSAPNTFQSPPETNHSSVYALQQALAKSLSDYEILQKKYANCHSALHEVTSELNGAKRLLESMKSIHEKEKQGYEAKIAKEREQINTIIKDIQDQANERVEFVKMQHRDVTEKTIDGLILRERELAHDSLQNARHDARQAKQRLENDWKDRLESALREERQKTSKMIENMNMQSEAEINTLKENYAVTLHRLDEEHKEQNKKLLIEAVATERKIATQMVETIRRQSEEALVIAEAQEKTAQGEILDHMRKIEQDRANNIINQLRQEHDAERAHALALEHQLQVQQESFHSEMERRILEEKERFKGIVEHERQKLKSDVSDAVNKEQLRVNDIVAGLKRERDELESLLARKERHLTQVAASTQCDVNATAQKSMVDPDEQESLLERKEHHLAQVAASTQFGVNAPAQKSMGNPPQYPEQGNRDHDTTPKINTPVVFGGYSDVWDESKSPSLTHPSLSPNIRKSELPTVHHPVSEKTTENILTDRNEMSLEKVSNTEPTFRASKAEETEKPSSTDFVDPFADFVDADVQNPDESGRGISFTDWDSLSTPTVTQHDTFAQLMDEHTKHGHNDDDWDTIWEQVSQQSVNGENESATLSDPNALRTLFLKAGRKVARISYLGIEAKLTAKGIMRITTDNTAVFFPDIASFAKFALMKTKAFDSTTEDNQKESGWDSRAGQILDEMLVYDIDNAEGDPKQWPLSVRELIKV